MDFDWREPVSITPIGVVESSFKDVAQTTSYDAESTVVIREDLTEGLVGIERFSHLHVLYYQHRRKEWQTAMGFAENEVLTMPLPGEPACRGVWTSRSPARPPGIGSCVVELVRRDHNRLTVKGLDAFDGTAVLDIKIYIPRFDSFPLADVPPHWRIRFDHAADAVGRDRSR